MEMTNEAKAFALKIAQLDSTRREHLRITIEALVDIYMDDEAHAVVVVSRDSDPLGELMTINCNEMKAFEIIDQLHTVLEAVNTADAPPKEMMN